MHRPARHAVSRIASPLLAALLLTAAIAPPVAAKTYTFPHVFETKGRVSTSPNVFDTQFFVAYAPPPGSPVSSAQVDLYLYDNGGSPMFGGGLLGPDVCNPCTYTLGGGNPRRLALSVEELIDAAGSFNNTKVGFGVLVVSGDDPDHVAVHGYLVNSHATPGFDISAMPLSGIEVGGGGGGGGTRRVFVLPHVFEAAGRTSNTPYTFDTTIFATYTAGLAGMPPGAGATVDLYLLDDAGAFITGGEGAAICGPCTFDLGAGAAKVSIGLESLVEAAGGFGDGGALAGTAILDVSGDPGQVALMPFVVNSHTSAFDVSVFGFAPVELLAAANVQAGPGPAPPARLELAVAPNPSRAGGAADAGVTLRFALPAAGAIELAIYDVNGREVARPAGGLRAAGEHHVRWDGRDASGTAVPPGVYFARLTDPWGSATSRIVAIR